MGYCRIFDCKHYHYLKERRNKIVMNQEDGQAIAESNSKNVLRTSRVAFLGSLVFGLIAQGMGLFNKFSWHDDIYSLFLIGETITSGRWMLHVLGELEIFIFGDGHFSLPLMNGLFSLLCISVSAGLIVYAFKIRSPIFSVLLGCLMAAFPVVTALLGFMFAIPYYMLALLMTVAGGVLICGKNPWWKKALGMLLGGCAVGIYQAFLPLLLTLVLLSGLGELAEEKTKCTDYLKQLLVHSICVAGVMGVYSAGSHFFLNLYGLKMSPYMGLNEVGTVPLAVYFSRAAGAYQEFFQPTRNVSWDMYPQHIYYLYFFTMALNLILSIALICRTWKQSRGKALVMGTLLVLYPLGCNFIFVMSEEVHSLMVYGQVAHFMLLTWLSDHASFRKQAIRRAVSGTAAVSLAVMSLMYARYDNQCYLKAVFQQQEAIAWNTELIARIKSLPGYRADLPVAWIHQDEIKDATIYNIDELNMLSLGGYNEETESYLSNWAWDKFMQRWCGFGPVTVDSDTLEHLPEVQAMPCYPDDGSVQIINGVIAVKLGEGSADR